jgi:hypothetical protein
MFQFNLGLSSLHLPSSTHTANQQWADSICFTRLHLFRSKIQLEFGVRRAWTRKWIPNVVIQYVRCIYDSQLSVPEVCPSSVIRWSEDMYIMTPSVLSLLLKCTFWFVKIIFKSVQFKTNFLTSNMTMNTNKFNLKSLGSNTQSPSAFTC